MNILTMRRFWIALLLPAMMALVASHKFFILSAVVWLPISVLLLLWAFASHWREKKNQAAFVQSAHYWQNKLTTPTFACLGNTYTFVENVTGTVIEVDTNGQQAWIKTVEGAEQKVVTEGLPVRQSHSLRSFTLCRYNAEGQGVEFQNALIINDTTQDYRLNLDRTAYVVPALLTLIFQRAFTACPVAALAVPMLFKVIHRLLCLSAFVTFCALLWQFKDGYDWRQHEYLWYSYIFSKVGNYLSIKWLKIQDRKLQTEMAALAHKLCHSGS